MSDNFNRNLSKFIAGQKNQALQMFLQDDEEYNELCAVLEANSQRMDDIIDSLSPEDKEIAKNYFDQLEDISGMECDRLYLQGYKDCLRLLCMLGVMEVRL